MTKHFIAWVIGWIYACVLLGILPMPLAVASPLQTGLKSLQQLNQPSTPTIDNSRSFSAVETFLTSLPSDYYTLKQVDRLKEIVQNKAALLIDVREPNEFKAGHIEGALNIPLRSLTPSPWPNSSNAACHPLLLIRISHRHGCNGVENPGL